MLRRSTGAGCASHHRNKNALGKPLEKPIGEPHRSKSLMAANDPVCINQILMDRLGKIGVHQ
jgi:hypothetical protein